MKCPEPKKNKNGIIERMKEINEFFRNFIFMLMETMVLAGIVIIIIKFIIGVL